MEQTAMRILIRILINILLALPVLAQQPFFFGSNVAAGGSTPTPAPVQGTTCSSAPTASCTTTALTFTTGNVIVAVATTNSGSGGTWQMADNAAGNIGTWTKACPSSGPFGDSSAATGTLIWWAKVITGGSYTVTLTVGSSANFMSGAIEEYSGVNTSSPVDQCPTGNSNISIANGGTITSGTTGTTTQAKELLVAAFGMNEAAGTLGNGHTAGSGWTMRRDIQVSTNETLMLDQVVSATGTYQGSAVYNDGNLHTLTAAGGLIVTLKAGT